MKQPNTKGFTLLEVLVAMTITALALGSLFSLIGGNKRLAWRAEASLAHSLQVRSQINLAQLMDEQGELTLRLQGDKITLENGEELEEPERKTQATTSNLRGFQIKDKNGETLAAGTYWIRDPLAQVANGQGGAGPALVRPGPGGNPGAGQNGLIRVGPGREGGQPPGGGGGRGGGPGAGRGGPGGGNPGFPPQGGGFPQGGFPPGGTAPAPRGQPR